MFNQARDQECTFPKSRVPFCYSSKMPHGQPRMSVRLVSLGSVYSNEKVKHYQSMSSAGVKEEVSSSHSSLTAATEDPQIFCRQVTAPCLTNPLTWGTACSQSFPAFFMVLLVFFSQALGLAWCLQTQLCLSQIGK